ncbi:MAG: cytochrome c oxidase subunit II [Cyanobacteria bacterium J06639_1]
METENSRSDDLSRVLNRKQIGRLIGLAIANLALSIWIGQQAYRWMPPQASAEAVMVDGLFSFMTTVGSFIFFGVIGTLLYSIVFQRAAKYDASDGPPIEGNVPLEVVWTAIPILLVIWIGTVSYQTYDRMSILGAITPQLAADEQSDVRGVEEAIASTPNSSPIEVRARQWAWEFYYPDADVLSTELHLPVNERARFQLTSEDVLHGFYVPAFRVKQDIVPGKQIDFALTPIATGRYRIRDSEYSGTYFAANQAYVVVESPEAYRQWLADASANSLAPARNVAYDEFQDVEKKATGFHWKTVKPAPAPVVNYAPPDRPSTIEPAEPNELEPIPFNPDLLDVQPLTRRL